MAIILSHTTARLVLSIRRRKLAFPNRGTRRVRHPIEGGAPLASEIVAAREVLLALGIPESELGTIDVLVSDCSRKRNIDGVRTHLHRSPIPPDELISLGKGLYVVDIRRCALEAATYLKLCELVEYYYEICGAYAMPLEAEDVYLEKAPQASTSSLRKYFRAHPGKHGVKKARRALRYVRDGARSPMETAVIMLLAMPKSLGGLGIREIEMDVKIRVTKRASSLTRRTYFYFDIFIKRARLDIEYNGIVHEREDVEPIDEERKNALDAMGYQLVTVRRQALFDAKAFRRLFTSIRRRVGIAPAHLPEGFAEAQEELRAFVLRRWIADGEPQAESVEEQ